MTASVGARALEPLGPDEIPFFKGLKCCQNLKILNVDGFVKSLKMGYSVIPVKTGIQSFQYLGRFWIPACAGMTTFYEFINVRCAEIQDE